MQRVLLANDHELVRYAIRSLINNQNDLELVGEASSYDELISMVQLTQPELILLDLHLDNIEVTAKIPEILKHCPLVLVLAFHPDRETHLLALRLGALGIITKDQCIDTILKAIRTVCKGEVWLSPSLTMDLWRNFTQANDINPEIEAKTVESTPIKSILTNRELDVARLAARGLTAKKIAAKLYISDKTVRNQLVVIYSKLGVSSQVELVFKASSLGLLQE